MKQTLTQSMAWLHTWGGLIVGWLLFVIFLTGSLAVFDQEIDNWMTPELQAHQLTDEQLVALRDHIEANYETEGDLRRSVAADIRRKIEIGCYQGRRHRMGLPVRGQRTRTNARTRKGKKKAVAGKKKTR